MAVSLVNAIKIYFFSAEFVGGIFLRSAAIYPMKRVECSNIDGIATKMRWGSFSRQGCLVLYINSIELRYAHSIDSVILDMGFDQNIICAEPQG